VLRAIEVRTDPVFQVVSEERTLPTAGFAIAGNQRDYDITGDGERFLMVFPAESDNAAAEEPDTIRIVLDWFEDLKQRVPAP
jgi:hypothetical protein